MNVSIRLTGEEKSVAERYAKSHSVSLEEAFKSAFFERIEDEYDSNVLEEAYEDYKVSGCTSIPIVDFWSELDSEM